MPRKSSKARPTKSSSIDAATNQPSDQAADISGKGKSALKPTIVKDPVLGIPVLTFGEEAPVLTSEQVEEMLSDFP